MRNVVTTAVETKKMATEGKRERKDFLQHVLQEVPLFALQNHYWSFSSQHF